MRANELDGYVIIPNDILADGKAEFFGRNTGDIFTRETVADRLTAAMKKAYDSKEYKDFLTQRGFGAEWADQSGFAQFDLGYASTIAWALFLIIIMVAGLNFWITLNGTNQLARF